MKTEIGIIGLGAMGKGMALNILKKGFPLWVYDLRKKPVEELVSRGAKAPKDLRELCNRCPWILLSLPDSRVVESVLFGEGGLKPGLKDGHIIVDCGTTHPLFTRHAAATLKEEGIVFVDAPVSGTEIRAKQGTLTIMVGGEQKVFHTIYPLLETMGETIVYMGGSGSGQLAKVTNNVLYNISCAAMAEILPMAVKMGLDPENICSVVSTGTGQSFAFDYFSPFVLDGKFAHGYPMKNAYKDMSTVMELANTYQIPLPVTAATMHTYQMALSQGLGREGKGAMIKVWEKILGIEVRRKRGSGVLGSP